MGGLLVVLLAGAGFSLGVLTIEAFRRAEAIGMALVAGSGLLILVRDARLGRTAPPAP